MKKLLLSIPLLFVGCQTEKLHFIEGEAQGSTYHIKYISNNNENLQPAIDSILQVIDQSMSTYKPDSDISKINAGDTTVVVDEHFRKVFEASQQIWQESEGLFDPTVGLLVNAWGFGKQKIDDKDLPTDEKIAELKKYVGFNKVQLTDNGYIWTDRNQKTSLDGIYASGDVCDKPLRQVVTAVGDYAGPKIPSEYYFICGG